MVYIYIMANAIKTIFKIFYFAAALFLSNSGEVIILASVSYFAIVPVFEYLEKQLN